MAWLSGEVFYMAGCPHKAAPIPPVNAAGKERATRCNGPHVCSGGQGNAGSTSGHLAVLGDMAPEGRETCSGVLLFPFLVYSSGLDTPNVWVMGFYCCCLVCVSPCLPKRSTKNPLSVLFKSMSFCLGETKTLL